MSVPGKDILQESVMEEGRRETGMVLVTDTENREPRLTVVFIRSPESGLKKKA